MDAPQNNYDSASTISQQIQDDSTVDPKAIISTDSPGILEKTIESTPDVDLHLADASNETSTDKKLSHGHALEESESEVEDIITIYTAKQLAKPDNKAFFTTKSRLDEHPDYSSTTSESDNDQLATADAKFFLTSDLSKTKTASYTPSYTTSAHATGLVRPKLQHSLDKERYDQAHADEETYSSCIKCMIGHQSCNRGLPYCQRCTKSDECVYFERSKFKNYGEMIAQYRASDKIVTVTHPRRATSINVRKSCNLPRPSSASVRDRIKWLDSNDLLSERQCPETIVKLIEKYSAQFESTVAANIWPTTKSCKFDLGRAVFFADGETKREIPAARYLYGSSRQFFVVWLPAEEPGDLLTPAICKFKVYNNSGPELMNGRACKPVLWSTWVPQGVEQEPRTVIRYLEDIRPDSKRSAASMAGDALSRLEASPGSDPWHQVSQILTSGRSGNVKRQKLYQGKVPLETASPATARALGGRPSTNTQSSNPSPGAYPAGSSQTRKSLRQLDDHTSTKSFLQYQTPGATNVTCIFQDRSGQICGSYPYEECDTAQKLFDVACVAQIAQIEPPATRLLKVRFEGGAEGRMRPDNQKDYESVFEAEFNKLLQGRGSRGGFKAFISPYL
ncbi:hypothetical protein LTS08_000685 [Lithohypha guttulata]|nr:hypothetical protein LTS08_000685 [Lithohypha guttulata]